MSSNNHPCIDSPIDFVCFGASQKRLQCLKGKEQFLFSPRMRTARNDLQEPSNKCELGQQHKRQIDISLTNPTKSLKVIITHNHTTNPIPAFRNQIERIIMFAVANASKIAARRTFATVTHKAPTNPLVPVSLLRFSKALPGRFAFISTRSI